MEGNMKKIIIIATIVIIGLTAAAIFSLKKENTKATTEVIVKKAEFSKFVESIKAEGTVEIKNDKEIFLAKNQRVETVPVEVGDEVKRGHVLSTLGVMVCTRRVSLLVNALKNCNPSVLMLLRLSLS